MAKETSEDDRVVATDVKMGRKVWEVDDHGRTKRMAENEALFFIRFSSCCEARVTTEEGEEGEEEASATHTTHRVRDMEITTAVRTVADVHLVDILTRNWRDVEDELMGCEIGGRKKKKHRRSACRRLLAVWCASCVVWCASCVVCLCLVCI